MAGDRDVSWLWLGVGVEGWTLDVAGGGGGPWMWLGEGMDPDVARGGGRGMHHGGGDGRMEHGCGRG